MRIKQIYVYFLFIALTCVTFANAVENTSRTITSGTYGVAWLDEDGIVRVYDGQTVSEPIPNIKVSLVASADVLGEGGDQLVFLDSGKLSLHVYSFKTKKLIGGLGFNVKTLATGQFKADETSQSVFASTHSGQSFRWTKEIMDKGWQPMPGDFSHVSRGKFNRDKTDNFATLANDDGNIYVFSTQWQTYSTAIDDKGAVALLAGNFTNSPDDEIIFWDKTGAAFLLQSRSVENLKQKITCAVAGKNGGEKIDSLYALDTKGKPIVYDRESKSWKDVPLDNAFPCSNLITRTNPDGNGHEIFVVNKGNLYQLSNGKTKQLSDQKIEQVILKAGDKEIADYRYKNVPYKPYIVKLRTPSGLNILRDAPYDHLHHHGLMFAIAVNGCNFWEEFTPKHGKQITVSLNPQAGVETSSLESELDWKNGESKTLIKESRKISVSSGENVTLLEWQTTLKTGDQGVILDKSNHHYFGLGMRFDKEMDTGRFFGDSDSSVSEDRKSEKLSNCRWMAYSAKLNGKPVTVAVYGYPTNPIPTMSFTMGGNGKIFAYLGITLNLHRKPVEMKPNSSLTFNFRVAVWDGEITPETIEKFSPKN